MNVVHVDVTAPASYDRALPGGNAQLNKIESDVGKVTSYDTSEL